MHKKRVGVSYSFSMYYFFTSTNRGKSNNINTITHSYTSFLKKDNYKNYHVNQKISTTKVIRKSKGSKIYINIIVKNKKILEFILNMIYDVCIKGEK